MKLFGLSLGKDDFVDKEEDNHGDPAVQNGGADVINGRRDKLAGHRHPNAVDGVDDI